MAIGLVLPCMVTGGGAPCDALACHYGAIQYLPSAHCGTFSFCLAPSLPFAIKETKRKQETIQRVGSDLFVATLPRIAVQSVTTAGTALDWLQPAVGEGLAVGGEGLQQTGTGCRAGRTEGCFPIPDIAWDHPDHSALPNSSLAELHCSHWSYRP